MDLQVERRDDTLVARIGGEIDLAVVDTLRSALENELDEDPGLRNIIVNLSGVTYIDSSGLGVLLGRYRRISGAGGRMFIVGASPQVRRILDMSGLFRIMKECASESDALAHAG